MDKLCVSGLVFQAHGSFSFFSHHLPLTNQANAAFQKINDVCIFLLTVSMKPYLDATYFVASYIFILCSYY